MSKYSRTGYRWSVYETLSLQREFELLGLTIEKIAEKHKRTPNAIMFKLNQEGFADYNVLYSNYHDLNATKKVTRNTKTSQIFLSDCDDIASEQSEDNDADDEYFDDGLDEDDDDEDEDDDVANLSERVDSLEEGVLEIKNIIKKMMGFLTSNKSDCSGVSL
jgi:hypothetical protein